MSSSTQTLVIKFGGTSVGNSQAMQQAAQIVQSARREWGRIVVVVSALSGVTDLLLRSAERAAEGDVSVFYAAESEIRTRHRQIADDLLLDRLQHARVLRQVDDLLALYRNLLQAITVLGEATPRALDVVASLGERMSVRLLAAILQAYVQPSRAIEASECIVSDANFQNAHPNFEATRERVRATLIPLLEGGLIPVVTGFIAATPEGIMTTLGRGGSDYSAALIAASLPADEVWIMTDVNGVMTTDPRLLPNARTIPQLTYREIAELAYFGAKVLHPKTIRPIIESGIRLRIANTFEPQHPGTWIVAQESPNQSGRIKAVTVIRGVRLITLEGRGMLGVPGVAARTFGAVAALGVNVTLISQASSEQSICFTVADEHAVRVVNELQRVFAIEIAKRDIDGISLSEEVVILTVVGAGMRHTPGIAGRIFSALGQANVNVIAIAQGSSEVSVSLLVAAADVLPAVQAVHTLVEL